MAEPRKAPEAVGKSRGTGRPGVPAGQGPPQIHPWPLGRAQNTAGERRPADLGGAQEGGSGREGGDCLATTLGQKSITGTFVTALFMP